MLHGSGPGATGWSNFRTNIGVLARDFRVLAVDMPGWGASDTQVPGRPWQPVETLVAFLDRLGIERATLVGNSMGGMTAVHTAVAHPKRVSHLITMGAPAPGDNIFDAGGITEGLKVLMAAYRDPSPAMMKQLVQVMCYDPAMATSELAELRSAAARARPEHLDSWNAAWSAGHPFAEYARLGPQLASIIAPTLALHGRDDRVVHFENSLRLVAAIPDARLMLVNRCGHWLQIERSAEFNRVVAQFITSN